MGIAPLRGWPHIPQLGGTGECRVGAIEDSAMGRWGRARGAGPHGREWGEEQSMAWALAAVPAASLKGLCPPPFVLQAPDACTPG